jgi:hypothetical protein
MTLRGLFPFASFRRSDVEVKDIALRVVVGVIEHERSDVDGRGG